MRLYRWAIWMVCLFLLTACQRFTPMENRVGLDNDSHSYTNMGYDEARIKRAAMTVEGVQRVSVEYNGKQIIVRAFVNPALDRRQYPWIEKQLRKRIATAVPITPFVIQIHQHTAKPGLS